MPIITRSFILEHKIKKYLIKKVIKNDNNSITLVPFNTASGYLPTTYTNKEILNKPVKILGVLKELRRKNFDT